MNFLEKLFGKKEVIEEKPVKINLNFSETDAWFESETTGFLDSINQTIKNSFEEIESSLKELNNNLENLKKAKSEESVDARAKKFARDNRIAFLIKARAFVNKINFPDAKDTLDVLEFYNALIKNTAGLLAETQKNIYFVNMLFAKETTEITSNLKSIGSVAHESQKVLQKDKNKIELISKTRKTIQETKELMHAQKCENSKTDELHLKKLRNEENEIKQELNELNDGEESSQLKQLHEQLNVLDAHAGRIKGTVLQMFSPLTKALKKYGRYGIGLDKEGLKILALYIKSPFKAVLVDKDLKTLDKILENTYDLIDKGKIDLKDKQKQKTIIQIDNLKNHSELSNLLKSYEKTQKLIEDTENQIKDNGLNKKIDLAKQKLEGIENQIDNKKHAIHKRETNMRGINQNIAHNIKELETAITKISNKDVSIDVGS
ncbi:MAG: hypothetical protein KAI53_05310 [Candidatus Aenigmarchaeota archaeon]|nr:hypothetical protein [Candidatus Aenigmarchaeota archaeon]